MAIYLYLYRLISIIILLFIQLKLKLVELIDKCIMNNLSKVKLELKRKIAHVDSDDEFYFILCGAAITIQAAWRGYLCRKAFKKNLNFVVLNTINSNSSGVSVNEETEQDNNSICISSQESIYFKNDFLSDVTINVEDKQYKCHSVVLWCNSGYFKKIFKANYMNQQNNKYHFKVYTRSECWEIVQLFIYGNSVIVNEHLLNDLFELVEKLEIKELLEEIKKLSHRMTIYSKSNLKSTIEQPSEPICIESKQRLQIITSYYLFFKCVINFHMTKKLSLNETLKYVSSNYIDYSKMNEKELFNCIYILKTKIKIQNSILIPELINNYLKTKP